MACSAGMTVKDFYSSTFDEVEMTIKGKVKDWRIQRNNAHLIHCSVHARPLPILKALPLPYDFEIEEQQAADLIELYKQATFVDWTQLN